MVITKKKIVLFIILGLVSLCLLRCALAESRNPLKNPYLVREVWPSKHDPNGIVLNIPSNYLHNYQIIFAPYLEAQKRKELAAKQKKELCDIFTCGEVLEMFMPGLTPQTVETEKRRANWGVAVDRDAHIEHAISVSLDYFPDSTDELEYFMFNKIAAGDFMFLNILGKTKEESVSFIKQMSSRWRSDMNLYQVTEFSKNISRQYPFLNLSNQSLDKSYFVEPVKTVTDLGARAQLFYSLDKSHYTTTIWCGKYITGWIAKDLGKYDDSDVCMQRFYIPQLQMLAEVQYYQPLLPQWADIQQQVIQLILSFREQK